MALLAGLFGFRMGERGWVEPANAITRLALAGPVRLPALAPPESMALPIDIEYEAFLAAIEATPDPTPDEEQEPAKAPIALPGVAA
ncbi:MAG: hypothetical protein ACKVT1_06395 [Dehalococcoidia bacterium]